MDVWSDARAWWSLDFDERSHRGCRPCRARRAVAAAELDIERLAGRASWRRAERHACWLSICRWSNSPSSRAMRSWPSSKTLPPAFKPAAAPQVTGRSGTRRGRRGRTHPGQDRPPMPGTARPMGLVDPRAARGAADHSRARTGAKSPAATLIERAARQAEKPDELVRVLDEHRSHASLGAGARRAYSALVICSSGQVAVFEHQRVRCSASNDPRSQLIAGARRAHRSLVHRSLTPGRGRRTSIAPAPSPPCCTAHAIDAWPRRCTPAARIGPSKQPPGY